MSFTEEWFPEASQQVLAKLGEIVADVPGDVVEIGSWEGRSSVALANAIAPRPLVCVDTWDGSPGEISAELAATPGRDVFATWQANIDALTAGNVVPYRMSWRHFVEHSDRTYALAFIDAEHTYDEVFDNIIAIRDSVSPGGIICGDDAHHEPVQRAVMDALGDDVFVLATLWIWQKPKELPVSELGRKYQELCNTPSDIYLHLPRMVDLVMALDAKHVIELGTRSGVSTIAWLHALEATGGRLTSVDIDERPAIGKHEHWTFIQGDDCSPEVFGQLEPADIVFIDTSHLYDHTVRELDLYRTLVRPGGVICLHDTELAWPDGAPARPQFPVKKAVKEFVAETGWRWVNFPDNNGFGVISVPGE